MTTTNNGNLPLIDLVVADPPDRRQTAPRRLPTPVQSGTGACSSAPTSSRRRWPSASRSRSTPRPAAGRPLSRPSTPAATPTSSACAARSPCSTPTETFDLLVEMISRVPTRRSGAARDRRTATASPRLRRRRRVRGADALRAAARPRADRPSRRRSTSPSAPETLPKRIPGMTPQTAHGAAADPATPARSRPSTLQITDNDTDFWDAVDFVGLRLDHRPRPPARCATRTRSRSTPSSTRTALAPSPAAGPRLGDGPVHPSVPVSDRSGPRAALHVHRHQHDQRRLRDDAVHRAPTSACAGRRRVRRRPRA